jgi:hypothetical protein
MTEFVKKQSVGTWITFAGLILSIIAFIIYGVNVTSAGYFRQATIGSVVVFSVFEIIFLVAIIALAQLKFDGVIGLVVEIASGVLKILATLFPMLALVAFLDGRIDGISYIYFSNEEILATIQTSDNLSSASTAITGIVFYAITWIVALVAAFFSLNKKTAE